MDIRGIDKAQILMALYNASKLQGLGQLIGRKIDMTIQDAQAEINQRSPDHMYFDYLRGVVLKIDLSVGKEHEFSTKLYNRDNGESAAERALAFLFHKPAEEVDLKTTLRMLRHEYVFADPAHMRRGVTNSPYEVHVAPQVLERDLLRMAITVYHEGRREFIKHRFYGHDAANIGLEVLRRNQGVVNENDIRHALGIVPEGFNVAKFIEDIKPYV